MADYRLLITEITNFGDLRCVAGWDLDRNKMIRPEPHPGGFWTTDVAGPNGPLKLGATVQLTASTPNPSTAYPHRTEDRVVAGQITPIRLPDAKSASKLLQDIAHESLDDLFRGNLIVDGSKAYVPVGTECPSLGGLIVPAKGARVESYHNYRGKERLRIWFDDKTNRLGPNLTATKAYEMHADGKIDECNKKMSGASKLLLRIGLARSFPEVPDKCYMQVNGMKILP